MNWENLFIQFVLSYISTVCFGILLHIPLRAYNTAGIIGGGVWVIYWIMYYHQHTGLAISNLIAAVLISLFSMVAARHLKMPMIVFNVPALVPFVPGGQAYKLVRISLSSYCNCRGDYSWLWAWRTVNSSGKILAYHFSKNFKIKKLGVWYTLN